jgi:hypothetical protein
VGIDPKGLPIDNWLTEKDLKSHFPLMFPPGIDPTAPLNSWKFETQRCSFKNGCQLPPTSARALTKIVSSSQNIRTKLSASHWWEV